MGLSETMIDLAKEMESYLHIFTSQEQRDHLVGWISGIRFAVKACSKEEKPQPTYDPKHDTILQGCDPYTQELVQKAYLRKRMREQISSELQELEPRFAKCVGGPCHGDFVGISHDMVTGHTLVVGSVTYELKADGNLYVRA